MKLLAGLLPVLAALTQVDAQVKPQVAETGPGAQAALANEQTTPATGRLNRPATLSNPPANEPTSDIDLMATASTQAESIASRLSSSKAEEWARDGYVPQTVNGTTPGTPEATTTTTTTTTTTERVATTPNLEFTTTTTVRPTTTSTTTRTTTARTTTARTTARTTTTRRTTTTTTRRRRLQVRQAVIDPVDIWGSSTGCTVKAQNIMNQLMIPYPNTPRGFLDSTLLQSVSAAEWLAPAGYYTSFQNQMAQVVERSAWRYMMYLQIPEYKPSLCAAACDARDDCLGFNIYFSRSPEWEPQYRSNSRVCNNPAAMVEIACGLYRDPVYVADTKNSGQWRADFALVTSGSNGYNKFNIPPVQTNFSKAVAGVGAVNGIGATEFITSQTWTEPLNDAKCAALCSSYTAGARASAQKLGLTYYRPCNFYNSFAVYNEGVYQYQYCVLYDNPSVLRLGYMTYNQATINGKLVTYNLTESFNTWRAGIDTGNPTVEWKPSPSGLAGSCANMGVTGRAGYNLTSPWQRNIYTAACNFDVQYSNDIGNKPAPNFYACLDICDNTPSCAGFAFLRAQEATGTCYMKGLNAATSRPPVQNFAADFAWKVSSQYAGFKAGAIPATVTFTTYTTAWTGATTATSTSFNDLIGYVVVQTPGLAPPATATSVVITDVGTATISTSTTSTVVAGRTTMLTTIAYPTPACAGSSTTGSMNFALYSNQWPGGQFTAGYPSFLPQFYKNRAPLASGVSNYIGEWNPDSASSQRMYGLPTVDGRNLVMAHTLYLYSGRGTGRYYFQLPYSDDISMIWVGDDAISGWSRTNTDLQQNWGPPQTPVTVSFFLTANTWTPIRVYWGNGGGIGALEFSIIDPNGRYIAQTTPNTNSGYFSPMLRAATCSSLDAPAFPRWGAET